MGILYEQSFLAFLILTVILGGGAAWMTGRALASTWRPAWQIIPYVLLLTGAVRFLDYALLAGTLLSLQFYVVTAAILLLAAGIGFRLTRAGQMVTQYRWIYERTGPFTWRERGSSSEEARKA